MTNPTPERLPWDHDALGIVDQHAPPEIRERLRLEIEGLARLRGEDRVTLDTLLAIEDLLAGR